MWLACAVRDAEGVCGWVTISGWMPACSRQAARVGAMDGRSVEYRGTAEIATAIAELERELHTMQGTSPVRHIRVFTSKGL
jgi:hypothetical protein